MIKILFGLTFLLTSISAFSVDYRCTGTDKGIFYIDASEEPKTIGFVGGKEFFLSDSGRLTSLRIEDENEISIFISESGSIIYRKNTRNGSIVVKCDSLE